MDLEEFRRSYMHMESVGNSPGNFFRRAATLAKNIGAIGPAIKKTDKPQNTGTRSGRRLKKSSKKMG